MNQIFMHRPTGREKGVDVSHTPITQSIQVNEQIIESWAELNRLLFEGTWQPGLQRFRGNFAYRGVAGTEATLRTSLDRLGDREGRVEAHLLRTFRKYAHRDEVPGDSIWNWLALGQHHGLPTRLLDWTFSPFVAMHFVTQDPEAYDADGVIHRVDYGLAHQLLPEKLRAILKEEDVTIFTTEMLDRAASTLGHFDKLSKKPFAAFFEPPSLDDRIVNQFALFSLMSSATAQFEDWLIDHPDLTVRYVIPANLKWEIRDKLDQANITERVLFPGLDGLSRLLKRYYTPRKPEARK
jgi:hypothetical protein